MTAMGDWEAFRADVEAEHEAKEALRASVRELESELRGVMSSLQTVHEDASPKAIAALLAGVDAKLNALKTGFAALAPKVAPLEFFKYHDIYRFVVQRSVFAVALVHYLREGQLLGKAAAAKALGVSDDPKDGFYLDLEDYLHGVLELAKELARLSVNAVVVGDFERPHAVRSFLTSLDAGFRSLNLKNDGLRRRFDALKYDLKKVEEVVYDLSIRNLKTVAPAEAAAQSPPAAME